MKVSSRELWVLCFTLLCLLSSTVALNNDGNIWDPLEVFCGSRDCYTLLGVENEANTTTISKAYRKISRSIHPDKVREASQKANATEMFRIVAKAYEVLGGNETRPNYDYYLEHGSRSYYRFADGRGVWKALPKTPAWFVIIAALALASWFWHIVQMQKHNRARGMLRRQIVEKWDKNSGATDIAMNLEKKAVKAYESVLRESKDPADKGKVKGLYSSQGRSRIAKDEAFLKIVDDLLNDIADWGEYYKPERKHLLIVRCFFIPHMLFAFGVKYHRRYISSTPLSDEEKEEMCLEMVGFTTWDQLTKEEKKEAVELEVWKSEAYDKWREDREAKYFNSKKFRRQVRRGAFDDE